MRLRRFKPGGFSTRPGMALVGEKGPEVVVCVKGTTDEIVDAVLREIERRKRRNGGTGL